MLCIPEQQVPNKKRDGKAVLVTKNLSQVDATHESSERMTLKDAQEVV